MQEGLIMMPIDANHNNSPDSDKDETDDVALTTTVMKQYLQTSTITASLGPEATL